MDGNNSLKRIRGIGDRAVADIRVFSGSDYYLSTDFVDKFSNEIKSRQSTGGNQRGGISRNHSNVSDDEDDEDHATEGDPTDGDPDISHVTGCASNWKAAASDEKKRMWGIFEETGIFASACQHGFILWIADMVSSGELYVYSPLSYHSL